MISFQWFKENARSLTRSTHAAAEFISNILEVETIKHFYPKKFICDQTSINDMEFIAVTDNALMVFHPVEENHVFKLATVKHYKLSNISSITMSAEKDITRAHLVLSIANGDTIEMNSSLDSNEHWEQDYATVIVDIFKTITREAP
ncbi:MAG: DUF3908 family protein [Paenibacillus lautus]|jgi:hypothetical protein|uniref:DUF3908 family protein n=1 Tax=Paenibacillus lautus TaxID=1401 RepID=UPI0026EB0685|nr:DUF3908 family protein [Paenibacillus lautus]MCI1777160.1 DUF3908 family protein [Paenibacillus lautus]